MALMTLGLGAEVDIATGDELSSMGNDLTSKILGNKEPKPLHLVRVGQVTGSGGIVTVDLGSPPTGRIWDIRTVTLANFDDHTNIATFPVALYIGNAANPGLGQLRIPGLAIASFTQITPETLWCHPTESVFILTSGALFGPNAVTAIIGVAEWREGDKTERSGRP